MVLLKQYFGLTHHDQEQDLIDLLKIMVGQYFCRFGDINTGPLRPNDRYLLQKLQIVEDVLDWESSEIAIRSNILMISITQQYLPGFVAHSSEDCSQIEDITMRNDTCVELLIRTAAFERFILGRPRL